MPLISFVFSSWIIIEYYKAFIIHGWIAKIILNLLHDIIHDVNEGMQINPSNPRCMCLPVRMRTMRIFKNTITQGISFAILIHWPADAWHTLRWPWWSLWALFMAYIEAKQVVAIAIAYWCSISTSIPISDGVLFVKYFRFIFRLQQIFPCKS